MNPSDMVDVDTTPQSIAAVEKWRRHGVSSRTNPMIELARATFLTPLGIVCEALEFEPFSALEAGGGALWLRGALFDQGKVTDKEMLGLLQTAARWDVRVTGFGRAKFVPAPTSQAAETASAKLTEFVDRAASDAMALLLAAAAELADPTRPADFKQLYLDGDLKGFAVAMHRRAFLSLGR